jgi:hypothetical protein
LLLCEYLEGTRHLLMQEVVKGALQSVVVEVVHLFVRE